MVMCTLLTLVVIPSAYTLWKEREVRRTERRARADGGSNGAGTDAGAARSRTAADEAALLPEHASTRAG